MNGMTDDDVSAVCGAITNRFWIAKEQNLSQSEALLGHPALRSGGCDPVLRVYFARGPKGSSHPTPYTLGEIAQNGSRGHATVGVRTPLGEVKQRFTLLKDSDGRWRIDCCVGQETDRPLGPGTYRVPSTAMVPTLRLGQTVTTRPVAAQHRPLAVGDIVVFHPPAGADSPSAECGNPKQGAGTREPCDQATPARSHELFIKRIVALPGDRISIVHGYVVRNGIRERDRYITPCASEPVECDFPKPVTIPSGQYFVLGDNRGSSDDSRFWGPIPAAWITGVLEQ
jgi:signal peptidase I